VAGQGFYLTVFCSYIALMQEIADINCVAKARRPKSGRAPSRQLQRFRQQGLPKAFAIVARLRSSVCFFCFRARRRQSQEFVFQRVEFCSNRGGPP